MGTICPFTGGLSKEMAKRGERRTIDDGKSKVLGDLRPNLEDLGISNYQSHIWQTKSLRRILEAIPRLAGRIIRESTGAGASFS